MKCRPKISDCIWASGIVDGEGCLHIARKTHRTVKGTISPSYTLSLKVTMGHEPTILRLRRMFGSGSKHRVVQVVWNPAFTWLVSSRLCESVLDKIGPYLFTKRKELRVAREFLALPGWYGGQFRGPKDRSYRQREYRLWDKMRRLKPRTRFKLERDEARAKNKVHRKTVR